MMISIIHPSRGRSNKSIRTIHSWLSNSTLPIEVLVSLDIDDHTPIYYAAYNDTSLAKDLRIKPKFCIGGHGSAIDAINHGARRATGDILIVVSDDTDCFPGWDVALLKDVEGKSDWILKTQDGIQKWIITMPVMDRAYYNRTGYIYHPDFQHMFCDTYLTCVADITGRKITSNLMFKHNHYSVSRGQEKPDELHKRNDATWRQGEETFVRLMKEFSSEELSRIQDVSMRNWLRNKGVR